MRKWKIECVTVLFGLTGTSGLSHVHKKKVAHLSLSPPGKILGHLPSPIYKPT